MTLQNAAAVALGSALGGVARFGFGELATAWLGRLFPWGTLGVNVLGSIAIGMAWVLLADRTGHAEAWRYFWVVGVLGGFTTFSSFSLETLWLGEQYGPLRAGFYVMASVSLCLTGAWAGLAWGRYMLGGISSGG
ncbi:MAG: fluoride efflux transporter FluC [Steroidobacteraceae bacterium]